jgi:hypothetical protein
MHSVVAEHTRVGKVQSRILPVKLQHPRFTGFAEDRKRNVSLALRGSLSDPDKKPCPAVKPESTGIEETFDLPIRPAGLQVGRPKERVLGKASGKVGHFA